MNVAVEQAGETQPQGWSLGHFNTSVLGLLPTFLTPRSAGGSGLDTGKVLVYLLKIKENCFGDSLLASFALADSLGSVLSVSKNSPSLLSQRFNFARF